MWISIGRLGRFLRSWPEGVGRKAVVVILVRRRAESFGGPRVATRAGGVDDLQHGVPVDEAKLVGLPNWWNCAVLHGPGFELAVRCATPKPGNPVVALRTVGERSIPAF